MWRDFSLNSPDLIVHLGKGSSVHVKEEINDRASYQLSKIGLRHSMLADSENGI